ncbi:MAG: hypothetical protein U1F66_06495 [bacterium]
MWVFIFILLVFFGVLAVFGYVFYNIYQRSRELPLLVREGRTVRAKVIQKSPPSSAIQARTNLFYEFQDERGITHRRMFAATREQFDATRVGDLIEIVYLPRDPKISTGKYWVDRARV